MALKLSKSDPNIKMSNSWVGGSGRGREEEERAEGRGGNKLNIKTLIRKSLSDSL